MLLHTQWIVIILKRQCWKVCGEAGTFIYCFWECKMAWSLRKTVWWFLRKFSIELPMTRQFLNSVYDYQEKYVHPKTLMNVHSIINIEAKKSGNTPNVQQLMNGYSVYIYTWNAI